MPHPLGQAGLVPGARLELACTRLEDESLIHSASRANLEEGGGIEPLRLSTYHRVRTGLPTI